MDKSIKIIAQEIADLANTLENQVLPKNASWSKHVKEKLYAFALEAIDQELASEPTNLQAKLWWFVLQLRLKKMPASALCPSYESAIKGLSKQDPHLALAGFCALELSAQLLNKEQIKQSIAILDHAKENLKEHASILDACLKEILSFELERALLRKESKSYLAEIENRIALLKNSKMSFTLGLEGRGKEEYSKSILATGLSSKSILEDEFKKNDTSKIPKEKTKNVSRRDKSKYLLIITAGTTFLIIIFLGAQLLIPKSFRLSTEEIDRRLSAPISRNSESALRLALETLPINTNIEDNNYQNIAERLEDLADKRKDDEEQRKLEEQAEPEKAQLETETPPKEETPGYTAEPISKEELEYDISEIPDDPNQENRIIKEKAPLLDPDRLSNIEITPLDSSRHKTTVDNLNVGDDGRIYGRPRNSVAFPSDDTQTLDGKAVRSYEVEKFAPAKEFITITKTQVLSAPSVTGRTITVLEDKTILTVMRKFENWLEVRSQSGQLGYVYSQDAVER